MRTGGPDEVHAILRQLEQNIAAVVERRKLAGRHQGGTHEQENIQTSAEQTQQVGSVQHGKHQVICLTTCWLCCRMAPI